MANIAESESGGMPTEWWRHMGFPIGGPAEPFDLFHLLKLMMLLHGKDKFEIPELSGTGKGIPLGYR